jgi:hypothetical protein
MTAAPVEPGHPAGPASRGEPPFRPEPYRPERPRWAFVRGKERPKGVVWFGARSFWGHMRHFVASAIATEDVDSRDWMSADDPRALVFRVAQRLGAREGKASVTESLERDVWIDYLADTGDDVSVSRAVAGLVFAPYELPDPDREGAHLTAPRGDVLLFGGDTAYPVATADEIRARVIDPFNQVLQRCDDGKPRVLLGIPGNHDWYDGLDGFGRMFRRRMGDDQPRRTTGQAPRRTMLSHYAAWAVEFVRGGQIDKPKTLDLVGYVPVQGASYFALPMAPGVVMLALDRQLKHLDFRQQQHFLRFLNQHLATAPWVVLPDPVCHFGEPSPTGVKMIEALGLNLKGRSHFVLSGDIHHYRREHEERTLHVTAGGGGACMHPAPIRRGRGRDAVVEFPDARQSRVLLPQVPWKVMLGRSGFLPHLAFLALFAPVLAFGAGIYHGEGTLVAGPIAIAVAVTVIYSLIGGIHRGHRAAGVLALVAGVLTAAIPVAAALLLDRVVSALGAAQALWMTVGATLLAAAYGGAFVLGAYLALLTWLGIENTQAFTALDHPGFKHFVRLRVRADGSAVDGWVIGLVDPLRPGERAVLVDRFTWRCR